MDLTFIDTHPNEPTHTHTHTRTTHVHVCRRTSTEESSQKRRLKVADTIREYTARSTREINDTLPTHDPVPIFDLWAPDGPGTRFSTHIKPMSAWVGGVSRLCDSYACTCMSWIRSPCTHTHTHPHTHTNNIESDAVFNITI